MAELDSLIRVRKHAVEQKQKILSDFYKQAEDLKVKRDEMATQLAIETEKAKSLEVELMGYFMPYAESMKAKIDDIDAQREQLEHRISFAQDEVRNAFAEMKKIEIIDERRKEEEAEELAKKDGDTLDEIALDAFQRNKSE